MVTNEYQIIYLLSIYLSINLSITTIGIFASDFVDWLIDFTRLDWLMSTCPGLFYALMLGNCLHRTFIFIYFCNCLLRVYFYKQVLPNTNNLLNRSIWPFDGTVTIPTTPGQRGPGSNGKWREYFTMHCSPELEPQYQIWLRVIHRTFFF